YRGYEVTYVQNLTDVDDKLIKASQEMGRPVPEIAERYIAAFFEDMDSLGVERADVHPRATEHIPEMIEAIRALIDKGYAYERNGDVYFRATSKEGYGKLSHQSLDELKAGARVEVNEKKENPLDFALWKKAKEGEPSWDSPWGKGRPGWHIECSVMAKELLGESIDIHAGGEDLQFPHHENEIAQTETLTGKPFANYWLHNAMINVDNKKMSKSEMNFFTVREISQEFDLEVLRFFILSAHYRNPINFSKELMEQSKKALDRLYNGKFHLEYLLSKAEDREISEEEKKMLKQVDGYVEDFINSMEDDINTADAIASLFELIKFTNSNFDEKTPKSVIQYAYDNLVKMSKILGILYKENEILEDEIMELIEKRTQARKNKDYRLADKIRDQLKEMGIVLEDTPEGVKWKRIN
ncbi:MAG: cysteine--tRNA ligase, partial [Tissierellales bacterium]